MQVTISSLVHMHLLNFYYMSIIPFLSTGHILYYRKI